VPSAASHAERDRAVAHLGLREADDGGQQQRPPERDLDGDRVGQSGAERRQTPRLGPHSVRERARKAKRLRGQRVQVDGVVIA
jgi:hypothetical protein